MDMGENETGWVHLICGILTGRVHLTLYIISAVRCRKSQINSLSHSISV